MASTQVFGIVLAMVVSLALCEGSQKRGLAAGGKNFMCGDFKAYGKVNWWYNWSVKNFSHLNCTGIEKYESSHVPMVWGKGGVNNLSIPRSAQAVLGFNEPNHERQSNMLPQKAAALWPLIEKAARGIPLVSPSAAPCGSKRCHGNETQWFDEFFRACNGCRVDYLAAHHYSCSANHTMARLTLLYERYGRKIWLTEFNCPHTDDPDKELRYMKEIIPRLEQSEFVYRYSWFASRIKGPSGSTKVTSLLQANASELTDLGRHYVSFNNFDSSIVGGANFNSAGCAMSLQTEGGCLGLTDNNT